MSYNPTNTNGYPSVTTIIVKPDYVHCPHCDAEVGDWLGDPRGQDVECDECGKAFHVHADADFELDR